MSELLRQRTGLESELNKFKTDNFGKNRESNSNKNEIENLKKLLSDQKSKNESQQKELEKFKNLYINAKSSITPFSDSKVDNLTDATMAQKKTPAESKQNSTLNARNESQVDKLQKVAARPLSGRDPQEQKILQNQKEEILIDDEESEDEKEEIQSQEQEKQEEEKEPIFAMEKEVNQNIEVVKNRLEEIVEESRVANTDEDDKTPKKGIIPVPIEKKPSNTGPIKTSSAMKEKDEETSVRLSMQEEDKEEPEDDVMFNLETPVRKARKNTDSSVDFKAEEKSSKKSELISPPNLEDENEEGVLQIEGESEKDKNEENKFEKDNSKEDDNKLSTPRNESRMVRPSTKINENFETSHLDDPSENRSDSSVEIESEVNKNESNKNLFKSRVSIQDIPVQIKIEFRLILQSLKIPFEKMHMIFPQTKRVGLKQLIDHFKGFNRFQDNIMVEHICRYLVENDSKGDVIEYDINTDIDKIAIGKLIRYSHNSL